MRSCGPRASSSNTKQGRSRAAPVEPMPAKKRYLEIEVSASDPEDDVDVQIPTVKFNF